MTTYDPRGHSWDSWCRLMDELFSAQQLGTLPETQWRDWGNAIAGIGYFMSSGVPDTRLFERWEDWAMSLVGIMDIKP